jgi:hypothetical protein
VIKRKSHFAYFVGTSALALAEASLGWLTRSGAKRLPGAAGSVDVSPEALPHL